MQIINVSNSSEKLMLTIVSKLRRLLRNALRTTKLPIVMKSPDVAKPIHNVHIRRMVRRHGRAQESDQPRSRQSGCPYPHRYLHGEKADELRRMGKPVNHQPPESRADQ